MNISNGIIQSAQKVVVYGPEGIGKSTFASKFPNPLFSDTEGSTKRLNVQRFDRPQSAEMLVQQIEYIKAHPDICKTYVIDTADWLEKLCAKAVCDKYKKAGIEDFGYGKGYTYLNEDFGKILNLLEDIVALGINIVITAHAVMRKFEQPDEMGAYDRWELKLDKRNAPMLKEWADAVLFVNYKTVVEKNSDNKYKATGGRRVMFTQHHPCWDAKNRYDLPSETEFDYSVIAPFIPNGSCIAEPMSVQQTAPQQNPIAEFDNIIDNELLNAPKHEISDPPVNDGIPRALVDLMQANSITEEDIRLVVSQQGYFPFDTKIKDYGAEFINGWVIACWKDVLLAVAKNNDLPFE